MEFKYKTIRFEDKEEFIRFRFLKIFYFDISREELAKLGEFKLYEDRIVFKQDVKNGFERILSYGFTNLKNKRRRLHPLLPTTRNDPILF